MTRELDAIVRAVCAAAGVTIDELLSRRRHREVVMAREAIVLLARELTTASYPEIAIAIGSSNHSTAITAHRRVRARIELRDSRDDWAVYRLVRATRAGLGQAAPAGPRVGGRAAAAFLAGEAV